MRSFREMTFQDSKSAGVASRGGESTGLGQKEYLGFKKGVLRGEKAFA